jgi:multiple sugar transport system permease protein
MSTSEKRRAARGFILRPRHIRAVFLYIIAAIAALVAIMPLYWIFVTSLLTQKSAFDVSPHFLPDWQFDNYIKAWNMAPWLQYFGNTIFLAICTVALALVTTLLAGYAFGTMKFPGQRILFLAILGLIMIPFEAKLIPDFLIVTKWIGWADTYQAQIIPFGVSISGIFLLRQFFLALPSSLWEAAQIDGCSRFRYLWSVAAPLAAPALVVIGLQVFLGSWNAFLWPFLVTSTDAFRPIEVGLRSFIQAEGTDPTALSAAACFTTLPILALFLIAQRQFIEGISSGSTKG